MNDLQNQLRGLWLPLVTPFRDGEFDEPSLRRLVRHYAALPVNGLVLAATTGENLTLTPEETERLGGEIVAALKTVFDPEIPADIYELGLIYKVDVSDDRDVAIDMTLTAPGCPVAGEMPGWVEDAVMGIEGIKSCTVNLVFDPPWDPSRMSDEAKLQLNMF